MVGLLILRQLGNLSDERGVEEWKRNPYFQAFLRNEDNSTANPMRTIRFCHFRKRIGETGVERI